MCSPTLPVSVDAQEKEDSGKSPDCVERLARKYMVTFLIAASLSPYKNIIQNVFVGLSLAWWYSWLGWKRVYEEQVWMN